MKFPSSSRPALLPAPGDADPGHPAAVRRRGHRALDVWRSQAGGPGAQFNAVVNLFSFLPSAELEGQHVVYGIREEQIQENKLLSL